MVWSSIHKKLVWKLSFFRNYSTLNAVSNWGTDRVVVKGWSYGAGWTPQCIFSCDDLHSSMLWRPFRIHNCCLVGSIMTTLCTEVMDLSFQSVTDADVLSLSEIYSCEWYLQQETKYSGITFQGFLEMYNGFIVRSHPTTSSGLGNGLGSL